MIVYMTLTEAEVTVTGTDDGIDVLLRLIPEDGRTLDGASVFTWERPEHAACLHRPAPTTAAVTPGGKKLSFCLDCNLLVQVKAGGNKQAPPAEHDVLSEAV